MLKIKDKIWTIIFSFIVACILWTTAPLWEIQEAEAIPLNTVYRIKLIVTAAGIPQTGLEADTLVAVMKNNGGSVQWYDFADSTFKSSGWTTQSTPAAETLENTDFPHYFLNWTPPASETSEDVYTFWGKCNGATKMFDAFDATYNPIIFYYGQ